MEERIVKEAEKMSPTTAATLAWGIGGCQWKNTNAIKALAWGCYDRMERMPATEFSGSLEHCLATCRYMLNRVHLGSGQLWFVRQKVFLESSEGGR